MPKCMSLALVMLLVLPIVFSLSIVDTCAQASDFYYVGRDLTTLGNWTDSGYGECGYALPYGEVEGRQNVAGETTGIGEPAHEFWWREPWSVPGEKYYPYDDFLGGIYILEYEVIGPKGPPRALVNSSSQYYRPSWYYHESSITVTLNVPAGDYNVSIYFLDWDTASSGAHRKVEVTVTSGAVWDSATLGTTFPDNFAAGTYAVFEVDSAGTIEVQAANLDYPAHPERYAVIAGIFLDSTSGVTGVNFLEFDRRTKGNWRPKYGNSFYLFPGFNVPVSNTAYVPINKAYDETDIPSGNYDVSTGVCQFAADDARTYGMYPYIGQYAAYAWTINNTATASDMRLPIYPQQKIYHGYPPTPLNGRIYGQWDSGELDGLLTYFIIKVIIPEGDYMFSIYAVDFERYGRSETIEVWDGSMAHMLDSQYITADQINNGIYVQWFIRGPRTINLKVIADPGNLNSFIDGMFLDCLPPRRIGGVQVPLYYTFEVLAIWSGVATLVIVSTVLVAYAKRRKKQQE